MKKISKSLLFECMITSIIVAIGIFIVMSLVAKDLGFGLTSGILTFIVFSIILVMKVNNNFH
ncbi:hypothetical protein SAMN02745118_01809 [Selenihalanaerobacter shriftii]|uniref:Uncharacterized protein n=1 Tax=Selenihalanaerobacter shriftii TaxID=142842 RepID=A0A1T4NGX1_9FIRM|nr:hypothetical protein SAMN02745118_01809 [Selenihalanaerobacter shriftii]